MDVLERAIESFAKHIENLSSEEIEKRLSKYNGNVYSGVTMDEICQLNEIVNGFRIQTEIINGGWFDVNSNYFSKMSQFFKHEFFTDNKAIWGKESPPIGNQKEPEFSYPQNKDCGFFV